MGSYNFPVRRIKAVLGILLLLTFITVLVFFQRGDESRLSGFEHQGMVVHDSVLNRFLHTYIKKELPVSVQGQMAAVHLYVISDSAGKPVFQPFNACYEAKTDIIFIDRRLVDLARKSGFAGGGRTLLAFVLLHELGHRTLHHDQTLSNDFTANMLPGEDGDIQDSKAMQREREADEWAANHYLELLPKDAASVFINEPDSLPLLNLMEGGLLTAISQYGPWSPVLQGAKHPSLYARVLNFYFALAKAPLLSPKDGSFYAAQALALQQFLNNLRYYLAAVIVLDPGDMPFSTAKLGNTLWISSYRNCLYRLALPACFTPKDSLRHYKPVKICADLPGDGGYKLFSNSSNLYYFSKVSKKIYRYNESADNWSLWMQTPAEKNYVFNGFIFSVLYDGPLGKLALYKMDLEHRQTVLFKEYDTRQVPLLDPFELYVGSDASYLTVLGEDQILSVYSLLSGKPELKKTFENINGYQFDAAGRYLELNYDRDSDRDAAKGYHTDRFGRPYIISKEKEGLLLKDVASYLVEQDIYDMHAGKYIVQDLFTVNDALRTNKHSAAHVLHGGFYTVLNDEGGMLMNDDILRNANMVGSVSLDRDYTLTDITYSRYLLVFDFSLSASGVDKRKIELHSIDL
ncbi:ImmA/IrrE family metallo-endopeptidase [Flavitalea flava]